jgi:hypothetical protein
MTTLPPDIENKINKLFSNETDRIQAKELMGSLWTETLNVGSAQLARSILVLSNGNLDKIIEIKKDYYGDPRDVIMMAEGRLGNPGHYFNEPFKEDD